MGMSALRTKVVLVISAVALLVMVVMYLYTETTARNDLLTEKFNALRALREIKADQIEHYLSSIENQARTFSENGMVVTAMKEFSEGFLFPYRRSWHESQLNSFSELGSISLLGGLELATPIREGLRVAILLFRTDVIVAC